MAQIIVTSNCPKHIDAAIELAERMIQLADDVETGCDNDNCPVVNSVI